MVEQEFGNRHRVFDGCGERQAPVGKIQEGFPPALSTSERCRAPVSFEQTFDFGDITADHSGVNAALRDLGVLRKNSRGVFASRRIFKIGGVPLWIARRNTVVQDRVLKKLFKALGMSTTRQRFVGESQLERGPALDAAFARERLLDFAKT